MSIAEYSAKLFVMVGIELFQKLYKIIPLILS